MKKILVTNIPSLVISKFDFTESLYDMDYPNISLAFNFEGNFGSDVLNRLKIFGIPLIGGPRLYKQEQVILMERLNIPHPKSYFNRKKLQPFSLIEEFDSYVDMDEFVVKPVGGARGIGVKKINRSQYKSCLENKHNVEQVFKEEREFLANNNDLSCPTYIEDHFDNMLVQEHINVKREFRVLYFMPGTTLAYERVRKDGQFCGNLTHGSSPTKIDTKTFNKYIKPMETTFMGLLSELNYPWLSIDVYVDENDNLGIFEFQMEFAYEGFNHVDVREAMTKSLEFFIEK